MKLCVFIALIAFVAAEATNRQVKTKRSPYEYYPTSLGYPESGLVSGYSGYGSAINSGQLSYEGLGYGAQGLGYGAHGYISGIGSKYTGAISPLVSSARLVSNVDAHIPSVFNYDINSYSAGSPSTIGTFDFRQQFSTLAKQVQVPVPQPYPVQVTKTVEVPQPYPVHVTKTVRVPVHVKVPYPVEKPYPVKVPELVPVKYEIKVPYPVEKPYPVHITKTVVVHVEKPVIVKVPKPVAVSVPQPYPVAVPNPVAVNVPQPQIVQVPEPVNIGAGYGFSTPAPEIVTSGSGRDTAALFSQGTQYGFYSKPAGTRSSAELFNSAFPSSPSSSFGSSPVLIGGQYRSSFDFESNNPALGFDSTASPLVSSTAPPSSPDSATSKKA